jgi:hypothetical protein
MHEDGGNIEDESGLMSGGIKYKSNNDMSQVNTGGVASILGGGGLTSSALNTTKFGGD